MPDPAPPIKPTTLTVTPIPASESKTLRFTWWISLCTTVGAVAPSLIALLFDLLGDPTISEAVSNAIPLKYRATFGALIVILAQRYGQLRKQTNAPIIGTPAATPPAP